LPYWDEGNFLSFYCKRPVAANNAMWGFKTMADVFSAETEAEASSLCLDYGIRYVYITTSREMNDSSYAFWQHMKKLPRSAAYKLEYGIIDYARKFDHWFYFWLRDKWALYSNGNFSAGSNFRLVYASKAKKAIMMPSHLIYEHVKGATLEMEVDPESSAELSLAIKVENKTLLYKKIVSADDKGRVAFHIPYSNSYKGGRITTDPFYKLSSFRNGKKQLMKAVVDESAIVAGKVLGNSDLEVVTIQPE
ncbi:MAG TPA: hypothetical protein PKV88_03340, partial [Bacteroidales bacterium]|nr:hypothetical protein [Bacteroidales bacterium]